MTRMPESILVLDPVGQVYNTGHSLATAAINLIDKMAGPQMSITA